MAIAEHLEAEHSQYVEVACVIIKNAHQIRQRYEMEEKAFKANLPRLIQKPRREGFGEGTCDRKTRL